MGVPMPLGGFFQDLGKAFTNAVEQAPAIIGNVLSFDATKAAIASQTELGKQQIKAGHALPASAWGVPSMSQQQAQMLAAQQILSGGIPGQTTAYNLLPAQQKAVPWGTIAAIAAAGIAAWAIL